MAMGTKTAGDSPQTAERKRGAATPRTRNGWPLRESVELTTAGVGAEMVAPKRKGEDSDGVGVGGGVVGLGEEAGRARGATPRTAK